MPPRRRALLLSVLAGCLLLAAAPPGAARAQQPAGAIARLLSEGQVVFGIFGGERTAEQGVRMAADDRLDFVFYSLESGPFDIPTMQEYLSGLRQGAAAAGRASHPLVLRIPPIRQGAEAAIAHAAEAIEAGVEAIVFPHVETAEQAGVAVRAMGPSGWPGNADGSLVNMLIIEDRVGVENADAIAATPGVGVVFAGPGDLSRAYEGDAEAVEGAIQTVLAACRAHDVPCGITAGPDDIAARIEQGFRVFIVFAPDALAPGREAAGRGGSPARTNEAEAERARRRAESERRTQEQLAAPRPIETADTVWIEDMTWMEVRDAIADGTRTAIVASGGIEQNGPYLVTGKHNVVLRPTCEKIARTLGDALCAPVLKLVPEGDLDPPSGHMRFPGTFSLREETFRMVLEDVAASLRAHGFEHIVFLGDSGGNQRGMAAVAESLNARWGGESTRVHYIPEFYRYPQLLEYMAIELGVEQPVNEGLHDDFAITSMMMLVDPESVRYEQRRDAGLASINGVPLDPLDRTVEIGRQLLQRRVDEAVAAIEAARTTH